MLQDQISLCEIKYPLEHFKVGKDLKLYRNPLSFWTVAYVIKHLLPITGGGLCCWVKCVILLFAGCLSVFYRRRYMNNLCLHDASFSAESTQKLRDMFDWLLPKHSLLPSLLPKHNQTHFQCIFLLMHHIFAIHSFSNSSPKLFSKKIQNPSKHLLHMQNQNILFINLVFDIVYTLEKLDIDMDQETK